MTPEDRAKLDRYGKIKLTDQQVADIEWVFVDDTPAEACRPGWLQFHPFRNLSLAQQDMERRREWLTFLFQVWRDAGGKGHGARWDADSQVQGAFIRFAAEVFKLFGVKQRNGKEISGRTLRADLEEFRGEYEPRKRTTTDL